MLTTAREGVIAGFCQQDKRNQARLGIENLQRLLHVQRVLDESYSIPNRARGLALLIPASEGARHIRQSRRGKGKDMAPTP